MGCFFPILAFASIGEDLNNLLDRFFGEPKEIQTERISPLQLPEVEIPSRPTEQDITDFRQQIQEEEKTLETFELELQEAQQKLWETEQERVTLKSQLQDLDEQLGLVSQQLEKLQVQEKKWREKLETITREKNHLKALIRIKKREMDSLLNKKFVQQERLGSGTSISMIKWIFSSQSVGEILEQKRRTRNTEVQRKAEWKHLQDLKSSLDKKEQYTALLLQETADLKGRIAAQKKALSSFTDAKARLIARLEYSEGKLQKEAENYRREQAESTVMLQNLREGLKKMEEEITVSDSDPEILGSESKFRFPLKIPIKVTAGFRDPAYEERWERQHDGTDFFAPQETDIFAPRQGTVRKVARNGYGYSYLILDHGQDLYTVYGHVSEILVNEDQKVSEGDLIARTGGTPGTVGAGFFTTGPHLHWEVFDRGRHRDPMKYLNNEE